MDELGDVAVMPSLEPAAEGPREICDRCGAFASGRVSTWGQQVCAACAERLVAERRQVALYPSGYLWGLGVLTNGAFSCVLAGLNWSRVGQRERAFSAWAMAAGCVLASALVMALSLPGVIVMVASVTSTRLAVEGWAPLYEAHHAQGGRRASLLLPLGAIVLVFAAVVGMIVALGG